MQHSLEMIPKGVLKVSVLKMNVQQKGGNDEELLFRAINSFAWGMWERGVCVVCERRENLKEKKKNLTLNTTRS